LGEVLSLQARVAAIAREIHAEELAVYLEILAVVHREDKV
jgi:hypothetical protein